MKGEFDTSFKDSEGNTWVVLLTVKKVANFCKENNLRLDQIAPETLDFDKLMKLCFVGCQHHAEIKDDKYDEWLEERIGVDSLNVAMDAIGYAILNFTLPRLKEPKRLRLIKKIKEVEAKQKAAEEAEEKAELEAEGLVGKSAESES